MAPKQDPFMQVFSRLDNFGGQRKAPRLSRKRDLAFAFVVVSLPLLAISLVLLLFVFVAHRERPAVASDPRLPSLQYFSPWFYYPTTGIGGFLLIGSWASTVAQWVVAPFMVLFSYVVAREILLHSTQEDQSADIYPAHLREIMRGSYTSVWQWLKPKMTPWKHSPDQKPSESRAVNMAGFGLSVAFLLS